ncbi:hypothetical protein RHS04_09473 [Rhizoctonia solani]|uniref:Uncharacterized protein n=1 Tax=Rhizoctonia solani TaxID=456999 RepID=A0A8H7LD40_9AGAM|nr:hypothetical protein RHS04_09473 [Rhizoctonia solani]
MLFSYFAVIATLAVFGQTARISIRQDDSDSSVGEPVSVGLAANRSAPAAEVFGTTNSSINFLSMPTTTCIVPMYASEAGIKNTTAPLNTQQALELCPQAKAIAVRQEK